MTTKSPDSPTLARDRIRHVVSAAGLPEEGTDATADILQRHRAGLSASLLLGQLTGLRRPPHLHVLHIGLICGRPAHRQDHFCLDFR